MLTASGKSRIVNFSLTEDEAQSILLLMRKAQDECKKVTTEYPKATYQLYSDLDVRLEQLKMKMVGQL